MGGQCGADGDQWGGFEEERNRPAFEITKVCDQQKEQEEAEEEYLIGPSNFYHVPENSLNHLEGGGMRGIDWAISDLYQFIMIWPIIQDD